MNIEVIRLHRLSNDGSVKAFVDITVENAILIKGIRLVEGKNGLIIGWPLEKGKDGKWYSKVHALTEEINTQVKDAVLEAYHVD